MRRQDTCLIYYPVKVMDTVFPKWRSELWKHYRSKTNKKWLFLVFDSSVNILFLLTCSGLIFSEGRWGFLYHNKRWAGLSVPHNEIVWFCPICVIYIQWRGLINHCAIWMKHLLHSNLLIYDFSKSKLKNKYITKWMNADGVATNCYRLSAFSLH